MRGGGLRWGGGVAEDGWAAASSRSVATAAAAV